MICIYRYNVDESLLIDLDNEIGVIQLISFYHGCFLAKSAILSSELGQMTNASYMIYLVYKWYKCHSNAFVGSRAKLFISNQTNTFKVDKMLKFTLDLTNALN